MKNPEQAVQDAAREASARDARRSRAYSRYCARIATTQVLRKFGVYEVDVHLDYVGDNGLWEWSLWRFNTIEHTSITDYRDTPRWAVISSGCSTTRSRALRTALRELRGLLSGRCRTARERLLYTRRRLQGKEVL